MFLDEPSGIKISPEDSCGDNRGRDPHWRNGSDGFRFSVGIRKHLVAQVVFGCLLVELVALLQNMTYSTTAALSMLSHQHQAQLKEIFESVGIALPTRRNQAINVKLIGSAEVPAGSRSRSVTPSRTRRSQTPNRTTLASHTPNRTTLIGPTTVDNSVNARRVRELMIEFKSFFDEVGSQFRHIAMWQFKPVSPVVLVSKQDPVFTAVHEALRRGDSTQYSVGTVLVKFFQERLGLRSLVEFAILDLLANAHVHRKSIMEVDMFVRIVNGFYDATDVLFLHYIKGVVRPMAGQLLTIQQCESITHQIFGHEQAVVGDAVLSTLRAEIDSAGSESDGKIDSGYYIYISLWVFHHQRNEANASQHGFEEFVRESLRGGWKSVAESGGTNLIDNYIDSIISLKNQTKLELERNEQQNFQIEEVVNATLQQACSRVIGHCDESVIATADRLMQAAMSSDADMWLTSGGGKGEWTSALRARDALLLAVDRDDKSVESKLAEFCESIAGAFTARRSERIRF